MTCILRIILNPVCVVWCDLMLLSVCPGCNETVDATSVIAASSAGRLDGCSLNSVNKLAKAWPVCVSNIFLYFPAHVLNPNMVMSHGSRGTRPMMLGINVSFYAS